VSFFWSCYHPPLGLLLLSLVSLAIASKCSLGCFLFIWHSNMPVEREAPKYILLEQRRQNAWVLSEAFDLKWSQTHEILFLRFETAMSRSGGLENLWSSSDNCNKSSAPSLSSFSLSELDALSIVMVSCLMWTRYTCNKIADVGYSAVSVDKMKNKNK